jgi:HD-GYP domain-containing protein (c-di-GMP phosphodiesterase class II)
MEKMKKILVEDLKPGMIYDKAIYVDRNNMLVPANVQVKEEDIKKLMTWGVSEVETAGKLITGSNNTSERQALKIVENYNELLKKRKKLIEIYQATRTAVDRVYGHIRSDDQFDVDDLKKCIDDIIQITNENSNIFLFLYGLDEGKDYFVTHAINVTFYAISIGIALQYSMNSLRELGLGAILINAGMIKVPLYITRKQSNLTEQEFNQIKTHPLHGYKALKELAKLDDNVAKVSIQHHEQFDGKGYPRGLSGKSIDEYARIASIADGYESQISNRSYRSKVDFYNAMRNLLSSGVNKYDPDILRIFLSKMSVYPIGSIVEINDSSIGIVIGSIPEKPLRPLIKLIFDKEKNKLEDTIILNLLQETSYYIVKALDEAEIGINIFDVL